MFTGIVEIMGIIDSYKEYDDSAAGGHGISLKIKDASKILGDCHIGDSISVNGICLTVTEFDNDSFKVGISPETVRRTNVGSWKNCQKVNLERAVSVDVRFGGHYVQGHIDTTAKITCIEKEGNSKIFGFKLRDDEYNKFIVEKGFICIDGASLTIIRIDNDGTFYISMIKHTQDIVSMPLKNIGDEVNIEVDLTGKVIEKQITSVLEAEIEKENSIFKAFVEKIVEAKMKEILQK
ncbi:hypothetical protein TPHA_0C01470 [Tetrapisispora phaffii CBS 4417]|uniref:Riboflavin synthase n=1 Tax=Tetrapisispora phaffii (strain ATCC 24235 / CBS 4417 / NBRC 1672 / NRRL Y-8282 / UCD 70-5) TaxID=1071381 RepID=G8BRC7_TETPH|nr:hypothetical protein TPHA_0C01470 [Tetrapisispora phaffii CBS 4417]CCE62303.1 hypothetical protein TPHA_0C01470 [Tetrapisispora phaffii CBS 4417]